MAKVSGLKLYLHVFTLHRSMVAFQSHKRSWNVSLPTSTTTCVVSKSPLTSSMDVIQPRACKLVVGIVNSRWISPVMTPSKSRFGHVSNSQTTPSRRLRIRNGSIGRLNGMTSTLTTRVRWFPTLSWVVVLPIDQLLSVPCPLTSPRRCGKSLTTIPNASLRYGLQLSSIICQIQHSSMSSLVERKTVTEKQYRVVYVICRIRVVTVRLICHT